MVVLPAAELGGSTSKIPPEEPTQSVWLGKAELLGYALHSLPGARKSLTGPKDDAPVEYPDRRWQAMSLEARRKSSAGNSQSLHGN
jgi:hypothetical protein